MWPLLSKALLIRLTLKDVAARLLLPFPAVGEQGLVNTIHESQTWGLLALRTQGPAVKLRSAWLNPGTEQGSW